MTTRRVRFTRLGTAVILGSLLFVRTDASSPMCDQIEREMRGLDQPRSTSSLGDIAARQETKRDWFALDARARARGC